MSLYADEERTTGFLRKNDREYLENPEGYGEDHASPRQTRYNRKEAIKKRLAHALIDMAMLSDVVDDELRHEVLIGASEEAARSFGENLDEKLGNLPLPVSLMYELVEDYMSVNYSTVLELAVMMYTQRVTAGGKNDDILALLKTADVEVEIKEPETIDLDELGEKLVKGQYFDMTEKELLATVQVLARAKDDEDLDVPVGAPDRSFADEFGVERHEPDTSEDE
jgi:hypothetical protein